MENKLKSYRIKNGLSQARLAEMVGITRSYLISIESGQANPTISIARRLAQVLDTSIDSLFYVDSER